MKKILLLFLCLAMLLGAMAAFASCKPDEKTPVNTDTDPDKEETDPNAALYADLVKKDFSQDGVPTEFNIYSCAGASGNIMAFDPDDITTTIDDAAYNRNVFVEENLGVEILLKKGGNGTAVISEIQNSLLGGHHYDVFWAEGGPMSSLVLQGAFLSVREYEDYVDFEKPWWYQDVQADFTIADNQYLWGSDWNLHMLDCTMAVAFNADMLEAIGAVSPYDLVKSNEWTMEKFYQLSVDACVTEDSYGVVGVYSMLGQFLIGSDLRLTELSEEGELQMVTIDDHYVNVYRDIVQYLMEDNGLEGANCIRTAGNTQNCKENNNYKGVDPVKLFTGNRAVFYVECIQNMRVNFLSSSINYGIVPGPKYTADQDKYISWIAFAACVGGVPYTAMTGGDERVERIATVIDWLSAYSYKYTVPAYYDNILQGRLAKEPKASEMLDVIFAKDERGIKRVELDCIYGFGMFEIFRDYASDCKPNLGAGMLENAGAINYLIEKTSNYYKDN